MPLLLQQYRFDKKNSAFQSKDILWEMILNAPSCIVAMEEP